MTVGSRISVTLMLLLLFALAQVPAWMVLFTNVPPDLLTRQLILALALAVLVAGFGVWILSRYAQAPPVVINAHRTDVDAPRPAAHASATQSTSLTGLPGRRQLDAKLHDAIDTAKHNDQQFALLMLDTDGFKDINGTLGHAIGDRVLIEMGRRLRRVAHASDTVAHFGGDNFVVLIENVRDMQQVQQVIHELNDALSASITVENLDLHVDAHFGVVVYPTHGETAEALVRRADIAKYDAKKSHAIAHYYEAGRDATDLYQLSLAHELHDAVSGNQLRLYFQPRLSIHNGRIEDMEALLRWQHPTRGLVAPDDFIPIAERSGSIKALTDWALREALRQIREWLDMGMPVNVGLNVSALDLAKQNMPDRLKSYLAEFNVDPGHLIIEVTETALMRDIDQSLQMLQRLKDCGPHLAIDDYGSGYSSLAYLQRLPVDELKIDKAFVMDMAQSPNDALIVRSTIELAHAMGLRVVAEGVEDLTTLRMLKEYGCDSAQGYLISKPIPADEVTAMLQRDHEHGGIPTLTDALRDA